MSFNEIFPNYPKGWRSLTLGELAKESGGSIQTGPFGSQLHASDYVECGIPSIMPKNISVDGVLKNDIAQIKPEDAERLAKYRVRLGDIVYSRRGDVEKCCLITKKEDGWLCGTGCLRVRIPADHLLQQYVHAYLCHPAVRSWVVRHAIGATMPNLNTSILSALPVLIPAAKEIQRIVEIWSAVSEKITLNTQINQTLEQMAQALFKSWFVDFDPVIDNALDAGNPIPEPLAERAARREAMWAAGSEKAPARLPAETRRLFPDQFEEDDVLGWVPEGWKAARLSDITTELRRGISPKYVEEGGVQVINQKCIRNHEVNFSLCRRNDSGVKKVDGRLLEFGDLLVNSTGTGTLGRVAMIEQLPEPTVVDSHVTIIRTDPTVYPKHVFAQQMIFIEPYVAALGEGSTGQTELSRKMVADIQIVMPTFKCLDQLEAKISAFSQVRSQNRNQVEVLTQLRDTLLPKLLSGELTVNTAEDTEREAEEVMA